MARIYVSTSWKNGIQPLIVKKLREHGHQVYDFRHPEGRNDHNVWQSVARSKELKASYLSGTLRPTDFDRMLSDKKAVIRFREHFQAMQDADTCVLVLPCGRSSHAEAGYMCGAGKRVFVMDYGFTVKPELMYLMFDGYFYKEEDLLKAVDTPVPGVCRICGCTEENPCFHPEHDNCSWVDDTFTLCSHCASKKEGGLGIKDDPETEHCINDIGTAFKERRTAHADH